MPSTTLRPALSWLSRRLRLLRRDLGAAALALGLPWLVVLAVQAVLGARDGAVDRRTVFFLYVVFAFWIGLNATAREIVGRRAVWRRELHDGVRRGALALGAALFAALLAAWTAAVFAGGLCVEWVRWPLVEERARNAAAQAAFADNGREGGLGGIGVVDGAGIRSALEQCLLDAYAGLPVSERRILANALAAEGGADAPPPGLPGLELTARLRASEAPDARRWAERFAPGLLEYLALPPAARAPAKEPTPDGPAPSSAAPSSAYGNLDEMLPSAPGGAAAAARAEWTRGALDAWCQGPRRALRPSLEDGLDRLLREWEERALAAASRPRVFAVPAGLLTDAPNEAAGFGRAARAWTVLFMTAWVGALLGLWISTRARTAEGAAQWVPLLTIPQILFNPVLLRNLPESARAGFGVLGLGRPSEAGWWGEQTVAGLISLAVPCRYAYRWLNDFVGGGGGLISAELGGVGVPAWEGLVLLAWAGLFAFLFVRGLGRLRDGE